MWQPRLRAVEDLIIFVSPSSAVGVAEAIVAGDGFNDPEADDVHIAEYQRLVEAAAAANVSLVGAEDRLSVAVFTILAVGVSLSLLYL
ncbi:hypothetical protein DFJ73DRAFT_833381 [Zopfochytrium polystomum]|nr:hypothetical protein DFJ73DRAFT_833381 [Zopfochytrium polystomum]